jgi:hypothetical protein
LSPAVKRRTKQREVAAKKAEKAAKAPVPSHPKKTTASEEELSPNQYFEIRSQRINVGFLHYVFEFRHLSELLHYSNMLPDTKGLTCLFEIRLVKSMC